MSIRITVQLPIKAGNAVEFEAAAAPALARVRAEDKGCEMYDLFKSCDDDTRFVMVESWAAAETAICIVDMWDSHHCPSAVERIKPLAVMMNRTVAQARARGISIIHAPSGCSKSYTSHPARRYTVGLPKATLPPAKNHTQPPFPIVSVDGGCDVHDGSAPDGPFEVTICNICFLSSTSP